MLDMTVTKSEFKDNEAKTWSLTLTTTGPTTSVKGETLAPGINVFHTSNTVPTGKATKEMIAKKLGEILQGAWTSSESPIRNGADLLANHKQIEGRTLRCRVIIEAEHTDSKGTFRPAKNIVQSIVKKS